MLPLPFPPEDALDLAFDGSTAGVITAIDIGTGTVTLAGSASDVYVYVSQHAHRNFARGHCRELHRADGWDRFGLNRSYKAGGELFWKSPSHAKGEIVIGESMKIDATGLLYIMFLSKLPVDRKLTHACLSL